MKTVNKLWTSDAERERQVLHSASLAGETAPSRVLLTPWGSVESTNGGFVVDEESARLALEAFDEHGTDLPIDYEHQTLGGAFASPSGQAPAAGWIKRLHAEPGVGILAEIEWTPQAAEMLGSKQYRYLSPVAVVRKGDRKLIAIHSAALTNKPAIVGMTPIVNRDGLSASVEGTTATVAAGAGEFQLVASAHDGRTPLDSLRAELGLPMATDAEEILVAASRRLSELAIANQRRHVEERVGDAMRQGKLVEAQRAWAEALVAQEEGLFEEWLATAPVLVRPGLIAAPHAASVVERRQRASAARARSEFRSNRLLSALTSEEAYVADAVRMIGD